LSISSTRVGTGGLTAPSRSVTGQPVDAGQTHVERRNGRPLADDQRQRGMTVLRGSREKTWPPMGRNGGHQRGVSMAAYGELSTATVI
jgi:hypothetical protein